MCEMEPNSDDREFLISRYIDGDLSETERREFERALRDDAALVRLLEDYRRTDAMVKALRDTGPELDWERFACEVGRRRESEAVRRGRFLVHWWRAPLAAAAAIALVCTAYFTFLNGPSGSAVPVSRVVVEVSRPAEMVGSVSVKRVAVVRVGRTPPRGYSASSPTAKSYIVATAGAKPFESSWSASETGPFF